MEDMDASETSEHHPGLPLPSDVFERADYIGRLLDEARRRPVRRTGLAPGRADEIVAWVREGRDSRP